MKKVLILLSMISVAEVLCVNLFGLGTPGGKPSDYLRMLPESSQIRQRCIENGTSLKKENKEACDIMRSYLAINSGYESGWFSGIDSKKVHEAWDILVDADNKDNEEKNVKLAVQKLINRMMI